MRDEKRAWNVWTSAAEMLQPLRAAFSELTARRAAVARRRAQLLVTPARCSDADVLARVVERLAADPELRGSAIRVEAVYDGIVTMGGNATDDAHARAFDVAMSIDGVRRVASRVLTEDGTLEEEQDAA